MRQRSSKHRTQAWRAAAVGAALTITGAAVLLTATPAFAEEGDRTAVVGPVLDFFGFGTTIGAPVFCGVTSASIGSGFQEFGASEQGNPLIEGITSGCDVFIAQGGDFVEQGKAAQAPYAEAVNPVADPPIGAVADAVSAFGRDFEPALAPFGPTIAGSGATIKFFQGSSPDGS